MSDSGKQMFASAGISSSLDTVLATTIPNNYTNRLIYKKSNNLLSEKSLSNESSKSSSGSSLTLTNNNTANNKQSESQQYPHHQFYSSQISTSANWNSSFNIRSNSLCSQKVRKSHLKSSKAAASCEVRFIDFNCLRNRE